MSNELNYEMEETMEMETYEGTVEEAEESGNKNGSLVTGLIIAGGVALVGGAIAAGKAISKKIKAKKEDKPKVKKRLRLVEVPIEEKAVEKPAEAEDMEDLFEEE